MSLGVGLLRSQVSTSTTLGDASRFSRCGCTSLHCTRGLDFPLLHSFANFFVRSDFTIFVHRSEFECYLGKERLASSEVFLGIEGIPLPTGQAAARTSMSQAPERDGTAGGGAAEQPEVLQFPAGRPSRRETAGAIAARCSPPQQCTRARAVPWRWSLTAPRALCSCAFRPTLSTEGESPRAAAFAPPTPRRCSGPCESGGTHWPAVPQASVSVSCSRQPWPSGLHLRGWPLGPGRGRPAAHCPVAVGRSEAADRNRNPASAPEDASKRPSLSLGSGRVPPAAGEGPGWQLKFTS